MSSYDISPQLSHSKLTLDLPCKFFPQLRLNISIKIDILGIEGLFALFIGKPEPVVSCEGG